MRVCIASLVCLLVAAPTGLASAQDVRLDPQLAELHAPSRDDDDVAGRVAAQAAAGLGTVFVAGAVGAVAGYLAHDGCPEDAWFCGPVIDAYLYGSLGMMIGGALMPLAITGAGELAGGRGDLGAAYVGLLVGAASGAATVGLGVLIKELLPDDSGLGDAALVPSIVAGGLLTIAGPIVAYAVVDGAARRRGPDITPSVAVSGDGATVSLAGAF